METGPSPTGVVNLYKPPGRSSAQYVYRLRRIFGIRKIGHAGTLDPFADGVLIACIGGATKLVEQLMELPKHYRTTLRLGVTNETYDPERPFLPIHDASAPTFDEIDRCLAPMRGLIQQLPPQFSAIRVGGTQSYHRARKGVVVALPPRPVRIDLISVAAYEWPRLTLDIHCGRGTYIRSIARDLGASLGCGACCETLTRVGAGFFTLDGAVKLESGDESVRAALVDTATICQWLDTGRAV